MSRNQGYDELTLAELLRLMPPAPEAWVEAAKELPWADRGLEQILALAETDAEFRKALIDDLEAALQEKGFEPRPDLVDERASAARPLTEQIL